MKMLNFRYYMMTTTFFILFLKKYTDSWKENSFNDVIYVSSFQSIYDVINDKQFCNFLRSIGNNKLRVERKKK